MCGFGTISVFASHTLSFHNINHIDQCSFNIVYKIHHFKFYRATSWTDVSVRRGFEWMSLFQTYFIIYIYRRDDKTLALVECFHPPGLTYSGAWRWNQSNIRAVCINNTKVKQGKTCRSKKNPLCPKTKKHLLVRKCLSPKQFSYYSISIM